MFFRGQAAGDVTWYSCVRAGPDLPHCDDERPLDVTKPLDHVDVFEDLPLIFHLA